MSTAPLSSRSYKLVVAPYDTAASQAATGAGKDLSALDIQFKIKKTMKHKPNTAVVRVWGIGRTNRQYLSTPKKLALSLEAGYNGQNEQLFIGEVRNAFSEQEGPEIVTTFETGDSEKVLAAASLKGTYSQPTLTVEQAFNALVAQIPQTLSASQVKKMWAPGGMLQNSPYPVLLPKPGAIDRSASRFLTDVCRSANLVWYQDQSTIHFAPINGTVGKEVVLNVSSGLIGSPYVDNKGLLMVKSLIIPGLRPSAKINLQGVEIQGHYRIEEIEYEGHSAPGQRDWYARMICTKVS